VKTFDWSTTRVPLSDTSWLFQTVETINSSNTDYDWNRTYHCVQHQARVKLQPEDVVRHFNVIPIEICISFHDCSFLVMFSYVAAEIAVGYPAKVFALQINEILTVRQVVPTSPDRQTLTSKSDLFRPLEVRQFLIRISSEWRGWGIDIVNNDLTWCCRAGLQNILIKTELHFNSLECWVIMECHFLPCCRSFLVFETGRFRWRCSDNRTRYLIAGYW